MAEMEIPTDRTKAGELTVNMSSDVSLEDIAKMMTRQTLEEDWLLFLRRMSKYAASWDFDEKAAGFFLTAAAKGPGSKDVGDLAVAKVLEFIRQLKVNPTIAAGDPFYTVWTDPSATPTHLTLDDLQVLTEFAALGVHAVRKGVLP